MNLIVDGTVQFQAVAMGANRSYKRPVAIFMNGIGDHVISLPAIRALAFGMEGRLELVCFRYARELFFADLQLRAVHFVEDQAFDPYRLAPDLAGCDLLISFERGQNPATNRLLEMLAPSNSIGHFNNFKQQLAIQDRHASDAAFSIPQYLFPNLKMEEFNRAFVTTGALRDLRRAMATTMRYSPSILVVHCETSAEKMWHPDLFGKAVKGFLDRHPDFVALVVGVQSMGIFKTLSRSRAFDLCGLPLRKSMEIVADADLFLGIDSCMLHVADICRVPLAEIVGTEFDDAFSARYSINRIVRSCTSMDDIQPNEVIEALEILLADRR